MRSATPLGRRTAGRSRCDSTACKPGRVVHVRSPRPFTAAARRDAVEHRGLVHAQRDARQAPACGHLGYEAEEARLTGKAAVNTDHAGYSGTGFVDRYATEGKATTTFDVTVPKTGTYDVGLRYSNGPNPSRHQSLSLCAGGKKVRQTQLPSTGDWDTWSTRTRPSTAARRTQHGLLPLRPRRHRPRQPRPDHRAPARRPGVALFDGTAASQEQWQPRTGGRWPGRWPKREVDAVQCCGDIRTQDAYQDFKLHVEFRVPLLPDDVTGQDRGNSGIYLQDRYELQILDSYGDTTLDTNEAGAFYLKKAPDTNAATAPENLADVRHRLPGRPLRRERRQDRRRAGDGGVERQDGPRRRRARRPTAAGRAELPPPGRSACRTTGTRSGSATSASNRWTDPRPCGAALTAAPHLRCTGRRVRVPRAPVGRVKRELPCPSNKERN